MKKAIESYSEIRKIGQRTYEVWKKYSGCEMLLIPPADTIEQKAKNAALAINDALGIEIWKNFKDCKDVE